MNFPSLRFACVSLIVFGILLGGCRAGTRTTDAPLRLDVVGPVEIDVESFNGNVIITADDRQDAATVRVGRVATHGLGRLDEARFTLEEIGYSAEIVPGELGPRLQVRTWTDHPEPHFQRAPVHITVPEIDSVYVRTTNGRVNVRGVQGRVDIATTNGDVRVVTNNPMRQPVTIVNNRGNIDYRVRGESTAQFDCETIGGRVMHRVRRGHFVVNSGTGHGKLHARLNEGENPVVLRTVDGNIRVAVVTDPEAIGMFIFD